jgi:hypothetical protein
MFLFTPGYQGGGGGVKRNIENVSVIFVFPKLKFIFLSREVLILSDNMHVKKGRCSSNLDTRK